MLLNYIRNNFNIIRNNFLAGIFNIRASTGKIIAFVKYNIYVSLLIN